MKIFIKQTKKLALSITVLVLKIKVISKIITFEVKSNLLKYKMKTHENIYKIIGKFLRLTNTEAINSGMINRKNYPNLTFKTHFKYINRLKVIDKL